MNLSPRIRFIEAKDLSRRHLDVVASESFLRAAEAALLDLVMSMPDSTEPTVAIASFNRIIGAREYLKRLMNIGEPIMPGERPPTFNLEHNLK